MGAGGPGGGPLAPGGLPMGGGGAAGMDGRQRSDAARRGEGRGESALSGGAGARNPLQQSPLLMP